MGWRISMKRLWAMTVVMFSPSLAFAFEFDWSNSPDDKSIQYLGMIFGNVGNALNGASGNAFVGNLFYIFNIAVLTLGSLLVAYTVVTSALHTAQEGEIMGKQMSSMWVPFRSLMGVVLLMPTPSGYSILQIMLMNIIVLGISAANQLWKEVVNSSLSQTGSGLFGGISVDEDRLFETSAALLTSMTCVRAFNNSLSCLASLPENSYVSAYTDGNTLYFGVQGDPNYDSVCGYAKAGPAPAQADDTKVAGGLSPWEAANLSALINAAGALAGPAQGIVENKLSSSQDVFADAVNQLKGGIVSAPRKTDEEGDYVQTQKQHDTAQYAIKQGWIFAGSYYFMLMKSNRTLHWEGYQPVTDTGGTDQLVSEECKADLNMAQVAANKVINSYEDSDSATGGKVRVSTVSSKTDGVVAKFQKALTKPLNKLAIKIMQRLTTRNADPITSVKEMGTEILITAEVLWFATIVASFAILLAACSMSMMNPACFAVSAVLTFIVPLIIAFVSLMWAGGAALAIFTPLVPYLVYTFTALGWMLLVIEAMAAAPVVALGLAAPTQEHMGRASPAVLILTNIFLRPSLMLIGFLAAAKLVRVAVQLINAGFFAVVKTSIGGLGIFGIVALIVIYSGVILSVISECFSIIHILPDKIVRWIGGQAETSGVKEKLQEAKAAGQKGAEIGAGLMKGSLGWAGEKIAEKRKEDKEKMEKDAAKAAALAALEKKKKGGA